FPSPPAMPSDWNGPAPPTPRRYQRTLTVDVEARSVAAVANGGLSSSPPAVGTNARRQPPSSARPRNVGARAWTGFTASRRRDSFAATPVGPAAPSHMGVPAGGAGVSARLKGGATVFATSAPDALNASSVTDVMDVAPACGRLTNAEACAK